MTDLELKIKILELFGDSDEDAYYYRYFEKNTGEPRKRIKKVMDGLRKCGMVEHIKGLFDYDGMVAGSGFALTREATQQSVREWLAALKKMSLEELKQGEKTK